MMDFLAHGFFCILLNLFVLVNGHFILTAPKVLIGGSKAHLSMIVFNATEGENITLILKAGGHIIAESHVSVRNNHNMLVEINVPPVPLETTGLLQVLANFRNGYVINKENAVRIRPARFLTLVQTDKPLYKPGQTIKFRVFPMDNQLRPLGNDTVGDIWIDDPSGTRVEQWKQVKFTEAIKQFELPLSEEPILGTWKINTEINNVPSSQTFRVEKYVLPKFEVIINAPSVVWAGTDNIALEVCAKYTYGKFVKGTVGVRIDYPIQRGRFVIPPVEYLDEISGCHEFVVREEDMMLPSYAFGRDGMSKPLTIFTNVTERGTGIMRTATTEIAITLQRLFIDFAGNNEYFKKTLPYYGQLQVKKPNGSPADAERIETCATFEFENDQFVRCETLTSDKSGIVHFSIAPSSAGKIQLKASGLDFILTQNSNSLTGKPAFQTPVGEMEIKPWFSPSDSHLQIMNTSDELACDKLQHIKILYNSKNGRKTKFYYQVLSKGRIVEQGSYRHTFKSKEDNETKYDLNDLLLRPKNIGEFVLTFEIKASMSPKIRLLVFYVRKDKEIVADSKTFRISLCLQNKVNFQFHQQKQYPGTDATMMLSASPHSLCGIKMVDKSVKLMESKEKAFITQKHIFKSLETDDVGKFDHPRMDATSYCYEDIYKEAKSDPRCHDYNYFETTKTIKGYPYVDAVMAFEEAGTVFISDLTMRTKPCIRVIRLHTVKRYQEEDSPLGIFNPSRSPDKTKKSKVVDEVRSYFPETWLWEIHSIDSTGEKSIERQLPHTITEWTGGAICIHPETGLGISQDSNITTFQPFFIDFQLPYSVIRGEALPLIVTVFNYLSQCLQIKLSLEPSEEFYLLSEFRFAKICVCVGQSESHKFLIRPVILGKVNITVHAYSKEDDKEICGNKITASLNTKDAVTKQLLVEAEGFPKEEVLNYFICLENSNKSYAAEVDLLLPDDVISESGRAYMTVTGDVMGPALNGLEKLVNLPTGCGEQNMVLFAPNIFVLDYLKATGKITKDIEDKCINYMKIGYQRELQYRHKDGSYSAFGNRDYEGSLWLTAFVLRSFSQAKRFITMDEKDLSRSTNWILKMQKKNGCFRPSGMVLHKEMKGGLGRGKKSFAPLTAYVLISLLESATELSDQDFVRKGLECLKSESRPDNYALALFAYAFALAKDFSAAKEYVRQLDRQAVIIGNQKYWNSSSLSKSVSVEISGYYILAQLEINKSVGVTKSLPVVHWVIEQRNSNGGFISTQDTLVALQALAKYASYQSYSEIDIGLTIQNDYLVHSLNVREDNKLVTQTVKIPVLPAVLDLEVKGSGCVLVQFSVRYNIESISDNLDFDLNVDTNRLEDGDFNLTSLNICMRYNVRNETSNMVLLLVKMLSGFLPDESSLLELQNGRKVQLKRYETNGNDVNLYFDKLTHHQKCFNFKMMNEFEVVDLKPSIVRLYDYYQPEKSVFVEYSIGNSISESFSPELSSPLRKDAEQYEDEA